MKKITERHGSHNREKRQLEFKHSLAALAACLLVFSLTLGLVQADHMQGTVSAPVPAPIQISPSNGGTSTSRAPTFTWENIRPADDYQLQVDDDSSFSSPAIDTTVTNKWYSPPTPIADSTVYYWRLKMSRNNFSSDWSDVWSFSVSENLIKTLENQMAELNIQVEGASQLFENAISKGDIGAYINIQSINGAVENKKEFQQGMETEVKVTPGEEVEITVTSTAENGKTVIVNMDNATIPASGASGLVVLYDGANVQLADSYEDVLDPSNESVPEYLVVLGGKGAQVLVSIPTFSTHTITITIAQPTSMLIYIVIGGILAVVLLAVAWKLALRRKVQAPAPPLPVLAPPPPVPPSQKSQG